jgi:type III secretion protein J
MSGKPSKRCFAAVDLQGLRRAKQAAALALVLCLSACTDEVYSNLDQRQANEVIAVLAENGINASRTGSGEAYGVSIASADMSEAARILESQGLPRQRYQTVTELFPGDSMIVTPFEQEARMAFALGQELSRTLESIEGVRTAQVHVVLPKRDLRDRVISDASASVALHTAPAVDAALLNEQVRVIVANAVPALSIDRVSITNFTSGQTVGTAALAGEVRARPSSSGSGLEWTLFAIAAALAALAGLYLMIGARQRSNP